MLGAGLAWFLAPYNGVKKGQKPLSEKAVWKIVEKRVKAAVISTHVSAHSTRHTFIILALNNGAAGHANPRTTERYGRTKENLDDNAVDYVKL